MPVRPEVGMYYMRIIATNPSPSWDSLGTLVHLTIGHPDSIPRQLPDDTIVCNIVISGITIGPFNGYTMSSHHGIPLRSITGRPSSGVTIQFS
jgi:hypothetical protein